MKVVDKKISDSIILGRITHVEDPPYTFGKDERTSQYKFVITVQVSFEDQKNKKVIWEDQLSTFAVYNEGDRETGITEAVEKVSEDIVNKIIAGW